LSFCSPDCNLLCRVQRKSARQNVHGFYSPIQKISSIMSHVGCLCREVQSKSVLQNVCGFYSAIQKVSNTMFHVGCSCWKVQSKSVPWNICGFYSSLQIFLRMQLSHCLKFQRKSTGVCVIFTLLFECPECAPQVQVVCAQKYRANLVCKISVVFPPTQTVSSIIMLCRKVRSKSVLWNVCFFCSFVGNLERNLPCQVV